MRKVTAPSFKEVQATTAVVIITVFLFGVYFWIIDLAIGRGIDYAISRLWRITKSRKEAGIYSNTMQDEAKNQAAAEDAEGASRRQSKARRRSPAQSEHEVVHHPLLFGI